MGKDTYSPNRWRRRQRERCSESSRSGESNSVTAGEEMDEDSLSLCWVNGNKQLHFL